MTSALQETASTGVNGAPRTGDQLQGAASGLLDQAARTADAQASTTMTRVGQTLDGIARSIDDAAAGMRETQPDIANLVQTAGEQVSSAATYLRDHTASDALDNVQQLARRQPALVVGGGLVLGLVLGRMLRTGAAIAQTDMQGTGTYERGYSGQGGATIARGVTTGAAGATGGYASTYDTGGYGASSGYEASTGYDASSEYADTSGSASTAEELTATDAAADESLADLETAETTTTKTRRTKSSGGSR